MSDEHSFIRRLALSWPPDDWSDLTVLVGVSGGADSVALLVGLSRVRRPGSGNLVAAHFNHQLRGADSDADEYFVTALASRLGLRCEVGRPEPTGFSLKKPHIRNGLEAACRSARYRFLQATAEQVGARYVAVAHTADDQAETILHRILRGTGLAGLAGIRRARPLGPAVTLIRPLLGERRAELLAWLANCGQTFREDSSNQDTRLTRNRLRHELLPLLRRDYNPQVDEALLRLGFLACEAQMVLDGLVAHLADRCVVRRTARSLAVDSSQLAGEPRCLAREFLLRQWRQQGWPEQDMGWAEWESLAAMLEGAAGPAARTYPGNVRAERDGPLLVLTEIVGKPVDAG